MTVAYVDGVSGASGDMLVGALLDAGWPVDALRATLARFPLAGWTLRAERVQRQGIAATQVSFDLPSGQPPRRLDDLLQLLMGAQLPGGIHDRAERVLRALAGAEATVHGIPVEDVHFHEIGALDTLFDVVGVAAGLAELGIDRLLVGPLNVGGGTVRMAHGALPVPPPAVALLARDLITYGTPDAGELLTPTGAALLATLGTTLPAQPPLRISAAGYGAGRKQLPHANVVRLILGADATQSTAADPASPTSLRNELMVLQCNIDNLNPELYPYLLEQIFAAGALDAWLMPIIMKKGRPGVLVSVLASPEGTPVIRETLFRETSTLGIRTTAAQRDRLERRWEWVETIYGPIRVKVGLLGEEVVNRAPEYEDCAAAARQHGVALKRVYAAALAALPDPQP
jgi:pyridinium-3,5-bisthiocarboxylic acid mononucleotide nickel chelatase